ncbi:MAG TPA: hypothetical protein VMF32_00775 [Xanthobacteraceae bacterium]|nr:hypothetical protein [Xanthobacteraceae bacterium]
MAKALQRKTIKRAGKPSRKLARSGVKTHNAKTTDFCAAARDALKRGEPDAISDKTLQQVLTAAVKVYAAKVERRGHDVVPFPQHAVTATETVVTACGMIRAADLNMFDVAIWFHRPPGIE